ncbi:MAG: TIGR02147 family protein [Proteobacteria bacterium]|nr:MAG: TIGR02147 family protein [Pseudomonadota bacterium]
MGELPVPSIYGYTNYRVYLADFYEVRKKSKRGYSYRQFSQQAGFTSPNYLKLVIEGQRNLSPQSVEQFIEALGLSVPMAAYFRCLVSWNQETDDSEKAELFQKLMRLTPAARRYELEADAMEYIQHWIYPVLREMVLNGEFRDDPYWIERRLNGRSDIREITNALNFLRTRGFIFKDESGKYQVKDDVVISSDEVRSLAVRTYHRRALEQAILMLEDLPMTQREYGALIIQLPENNLSELKQKLKDFRKDLHQWALEKSKKDPNSVVVQCNFQMYPQSKKVPTT